jgi:D-3-phosphoglycerate dehydrogenase
MKGKFAVTQRSLSHARHPALAAQEEAGYRVIFPTPGRQPTSDEIKAFLSGCAGSLAGLEPISGEILVLCPELRVTNRKGAGVDNIDLQAAHSLGIAVGKACGANARSVAERTHREVYSPGVRHPVIILEVSR